MKDLKQQIDFATRDVPEDWSAILEVSDTVEEDERKGAQAMELVRFRFKENNEQITKNSFCLMVSLIQNCEPAVVPSFVDSLFQMAILDLYIKKIKDNSFKERMEVMLAELINEAENSKLKKFLKETLGLMQESKSIKPVVEPSRVSDHDLQLAIALSLSGLDPNNAVLDRVLHGLNYLFCVQAQFQFIPTAFGELPFQKDDIINVTECKYQDWWQGELDGKIGYFPSNFVKRTQHKPRRYQPLPNPEINSGRIETLTEMTKDVQLRAHIIDQITATMDGYVASGHKLTPSEIDTLQRDYNKAASARANILKLIEFHKAQLNQLLPLNEKLLNARSTFDKIMDNISP